MFVRYPTNGATNPVRYTDESEGATNTNNVDVIDSPPVLMDNSWGGGGGGGGEGPPTGPGSFSNVKVRWLLSIDRLLSQDFLFFVFPFWLSVRLDEDESTPMIT